jgi:O-acetyl-ADP-ribose deacetylase (regulator of RNase III)
MDSYREVDGSTITYTEGNIFDSSATCIVNPVNTVGVMGSGLALEFKKRYPHMFHVYTKHCNSGALQVGRIMFYRAVGDTRIICLFPTKEDWRNPSNLNYIERGLKAFTQSYQEWDIKSVAFPRLGCGLGGLDWEHHVQPMMERYLSELPIEISIYI